MAITSTGNTSLDTITSAYQSNQNEKTETAEDLGKEDFLTMLVAQLQNQDPLSPMEGTDFSAQLAQFSSLEQLMNLNDSMDSLASSFSNDSEGDMLGYMGKQVTGTVDSMKVENGLVSGGFFSLSEDADVIVYVTDDSGQTVKTLYEGTKSYGAHIINWDGTDESGNAVADGAYKYSVLANDGTGYKELPTSVTGTVEGIAYSNEKPYLVVQGVLIDPKSLTSVVDIDDDNMAADSVLSYIGRTVSSDQPILSVENGLVSGSDLSFDLEQQEAATIKIYDAWDTLVQTINVDESSATQGENTVNWNAIGDNGYPVEDGLYYYTIETGSGTAGTPVSEEVTGINYINGSQYLVLQDTGRLVAVSSITEVSSIN
jgi:flagellar basal-body rod modification protein FlgD